MYFCPEGSVVALPASTCLSHRDLAFTDSLYPTKRHLTDRWARLLLIWAQRLTRKHAVTHILSPHVNGQAQKHISTHTSHEKNSGEERDKQHKTEEGSDCFRHMWQESTRRITERGKNGRSRQSDRHAGQSNRCTDGQNDRQTGRQTDILLCKPLLPYPDMNI